MRKGQRNATRSPNGIGTKVETETETETESETGNGTGTGTAPAELRRFLSSFVCQRESLGWAWHFMHGVATRSASQSGQQLILTSVNHITL